MTKSLNERLQDANIILGEASATIGRHSAKLPADLGAWFQDHVDRRRHIDAWLKLLEARSSALSFLDGLETRTDSSTDLVQFGAQQIQFRIARLLGVQAYLTTSWSLSDSLLGLAGRVHCTPTRGLNEDQPAQLLSHFVRRKEAQQAASAPFFQSMRQAFGWPIGISYAIRNRFVHEGGIQKGIEFFDGPNASDGFRISSDAWRQVEEKAESYDLMNTHHRAGTELLTNACDDLRVVLIECEREMDDALGILIGTASHAVLGHIRFLVGED